MEFRCPNCSQILTAKNNTAGWIRTCPKCKRKIRVPELPDSETPSRDVGDAGRPNPLGPRDTELLAHAPATKHTGRIQGLARRQEEAWASYRPSLEHTGERQTVWPLDILLYPASLDGLITLGIAVLFIPIAILVPATIILPFRQWIVASIMLIYVGWYLAQCVHDSAKGGTRAPDVFSPGLGGMWVRVSYLVAVCGLFLAPPFLYYFFTGRTDWVLFVLLAWAFIFFPMGLLAMVILDSSMALNPFLLLGAISRTFGSYVGLLLALLATTALIALVVYMFIGYQLSLLGFAMVLVPHYYVALIQAHLLGRFYWHHAEELDWGL